MTKTPKELRYSKSHEWVRITGTECVVGITDHAQEALTDIVYVELPKRGTTYTAGQSFGVVESVKSVSDLYLPLSGTITEVNGTLEDEPELVNRDPYGEGWLVKVRLSDPKEADKLLSASDYEATLG